MILRILKLWKLSNIRSNNFQGNHDLFEYVIREFNKNVSKKWWSFQINIEIISIHYSYNFVLNNNFNRSIENLGKKFFLVNREWNVKQVSPKIMHANLWNWIKLNSCRFGRSISGLSQLDIRLFGSGLFLIRYGRRVESAWYKQFPCRFASIRISIQLLKLDYCTEAPVDSFHYSDSRRTWNKFRKNFFKMQRKSSNSRKRKF